MGWTRVSKALRFLPDVIVRGRFPFTFDELAIPFTGLTATQRLNLLLEGMDLLLRGDRAWGRPAVLQVEPTNCCSLQCPLCPTGSRTACRAQGYLTPELFDRLLDDCAPTLLCVIFYGWGEPFLNRDLPRMIATCTQRGIRTVVSTNGQSLQTPEAAEAVVAAGLTALIVAVDGRTQETYELYRRGGRLDRAQLCITNVESAKRHRRAHHPYTNLRAVLTRDALSDLAGLEALARDSGVNMFSCKTLGCLIDRAEFQEFEPKAQEFRRFPPPGSPHSPHRFRCPFPFRQPTVFWDGTVVGCEFDYDLQEPWGRIGEQPFREIWNGPRARALRKRLRRGHGAEFCRRCPYRHRAQEGSVVMSRELRPVAPLDGAKERTGL